MKMDISFQELLKELGEKKAIDIVLRPVKTIVDDTACIDIFSVILDQDPPILHVVNLKSKSKGFITLRDLLNLFLPQHSDLRAAFSRNQILSTSKAYDFAEINLPYIYDDTKLKEIAELMIKYETDFLPRAVSKKESKLTGIILEKDLLSHCIEIRKKYKIVPNGEI